MYRALIATGVLLILTGCGPSPPDPGPLFDNEGGASLMCMKHQPASPGARYTDPTRKKTAEILTVLRYYTANGTKPYCDTKPPTAIDKKWAQLYLTQGADRSHITPILNH